MTGKRVHYASILTIGDELLIGQTVDTNSAWIASHLNELGIAVKRRVAIGDSEEDIIAALDQERKDSDVLIVTGGLGPTSDDITKAVLCKYFRSTLVENAEVAAFIKDYFDKRRRPLLEANLMQAMLPHNCEVLFNEAGTAPGMLFRDRGQIIVSLPGVPFEMQHIMERHVLPVLKNSFHTPGILHKTLVTSGEGESFIAERLSGFEQSLPPDIKLAYLPQLNIVKLRLSTYEGSSKELEEQFETMRKILPHISVTDKDLDLEEVLAGLLLEAGKTISVAESCTGGSICSRITRLKGASVWFKGGLVPYTISVKENVLGVDPGIINTHSVVSRETVIAMAEKCQKKFDSHYALSVSGYLEKGDHDNEVWIGMSNGSYSDAKKLQAPYDRQKNIQLVSNAALNMVRIFIADDLASR